MIVLYAVMCYPSLRSGWPQLASQIPRLMIFTQLDNRRFGKTSSKSWRMRKLNKYLLVQNMQNCANMRSYKICKHVCAKIQKMYKL